MILPTYCTPLKISSFLSQFVVRKLYIEWEVKLARCHASSWWYTLIARFMGPAWGTSGADRNPGGPDVVPINFVICAHYSACTHRKTKVLQICNLRSESHKWTIAHDTFECDVTKTFFYEIIVWMIENVSCWILYLFTIAVRIICLLSFKVAEQRCQDFVFKWCNYSLSFVLILC